MTLVIALACKNGITMASDGQATIVSSGGPVKTQTEKIFKINQNTLFGASGDVGAIQKSYELIKNIKELEKDLTTSIKIVIKEKLSELYKKEIEPIVRFHQSLGIPPQQIRPPIADIIIAKFFEDNRKIIWHITPDCRDESLEDLGYGCTGNGDIFAHTLLKEFDIKSMEIEEGKLIAYNTIKLGIEVGAYGLGEPIYIWTLVKEKNGIEIKKLSEEEIMALNDTWLSWKETQRELFNKFIIKERKEKD